MSGGAGAARLRCLAVRPAPAPGAAGGDEVIYRRSIPYLGREMEVETLELLPVGTVRKLLNVARGYPPEITRFVSADNVRRIEERLRNGRFDLVFLFNEVTFPFLKQAKAAGTPAVLVAQNVHSLVAATDPSRLARLLRPLAVGFERRIYGDPAATLVLISQADAQGLRRAGVRRNDILIAPAGAPPSAPLAPDAPVLREAVITGSYGWWRKRRDLKAFAAGAPLGVPIYAVDPLALDILGAEGRPLDPQAGWSWSAGLRFGLVTDAFLGGFKLKSLEYVANNCVVLSYSDIAAEFTGLPHAAAFVKIVRSKADAGALIEQMAREPAPELVGRFLEFKAACLERFGWEQCLAPLGQAAAQALARKVSA